LAINVRATKNPCGDDAILLPRQRRTFRINDAKAPWIGRLRVES
jgi:hypothetical protein